MAKVAIITGAGSGLGQATAVRLAEEGIPQRRLGTSEEVAELVAFLLTSKAQYINGEVISIDGGFTNVK